MGVSRDIRIRGIYKSEDQPARQILFFEDCPAKWNRNIEGYWETYVDFILQQSYHWKDYYIFIERESSDYGLYDLEVYKNGEILVTAFYTDEDSLVTTGLDNTPDFMAFDGKKLILNLNG